MIEVADCGPRHGGADPGVNVGGSRSHQRAGRGLEGGEMSGGLFARHVGARLYEATASGERQTREPSSAQSSPICCDSAARSRRGRAMLDPMRRSILMVVGSFGVAACTSTPDSNPNTLTSNTFGPSTGESTASDETDGSADESTTADTST